MQTENLNNKRFVMKKELITEKEKSETEPIVIPDKCGDSFWDAVLD
jgi:hypothetical protein